MNKGGIPRPLFFKKIFNEYELTLLKKIDIENARKPEISKDSESKFTKGGKTQK